MRLLVLITVPSPDTLFKIQSALLAQLSPLSTETATRSNLKLIFVQNQRNCFLFPIKEFFSSDARLGLEPSSCYIVQAVPAAHVFFTFSYN